MATREIESGRWSEFFDDFSRSHKGWMVTVEAFGREFGAQIEARALPFQGITAESTSGGKFRLELMAGYKPSDHVSHSIDDPVKVWLSTLGGSDNEVLEIECADGRKVLVRFSTVKRNRP